MPEAKRLKLTPPLPPIGNKPPVIAGLMGNGGINHNNSQGLSRSEVDAVKQLITGELVRVMLTKSTNHAYVCTQSVINCGECEITYLSAEILSRRQPPQTWLSPSSPKLIGVV